MNHCPDPHARLIRALADSAARHGVTIRRRELHERPWSSATFTGHRLTILVTVAGAASAAWLAALPEEDLPVPGRIVADLAVRDHGDATLLEVLLLEA
ncbi:MAG: hypothetical protein PGN08_10765 [Sphingomonas taxi]